MGQRAFLGMGLTWIASDPSFVGKGKSENLPGGVFLGIPQNGGVPSRLPSKNTKSSPRRSAKRPAPAPPSLAPGSFEDPSGAATALLGGGLGHPGGDQAGPELLVLGTGVISDAQRISMGEKNTGHPICLAD